MKAGDGIRVLLLGVEGTSWSPGTSSSEGGAQHSGEYVPWGRGGDHSGGGQTQRGGAFTFIEDRVLGGELIR